MNFRPIIIVAGEPNSVFFEIFCKSVQNNKFKSPIILIGSKRLLDLQIKSLNKKITINTLDFKKIKKNSIFKKKINIIDIEYDQSEAFDRISPKSNAYIEKCFKLGLELIKKKVSKKFINGPVSKKNFLNKNFLGVTEYISQKFNIKKNAMLIFNNKISVCPASTHLPIKLVAKNINKRLIKEKILIINNFYKSYFNLKPRIAVLGLNPHCESVDKFNEDIKILKPVINNLKKLNYKVSGPYPSDTIFLKSNRKNFDVILGMYHDQVLTPFKTLFEYDAINITLGLPFIRISPDHGPNEKMLGKNLSNPLSLIKAIKFLDKN